MHTHGAVARLPRWLRARETGGRCLSSSPYPLGAPPRLRVPIESLLDAHGLLKQCVLLGFSRCVAASRSAF